MCNNVNGPLSNQRFVLISVWLKADFDILQSNIASCIFMIFIGYRFLHVTMLRIHAKKKKKKSWIIKILCFEVKIYIECPVF